jgi:hypothetical protein
VDGAVDADADVVGVSVGADSGVAGVSVGAGDGAGASCGVMGGEGAGARSLRDVETVALGSASGARRRGGRGSTGIRTSSDWHGAHGWAGAAEVFCPCTNGKHVSSK